MPILSQEEYSALVKECERTSVGPAIIDVTKTYFDNIVKVRQAARAKVGVPAYIPTTPVPVKIHSSPEVGVPPLTKLLIDRLDALKQQVYTVKMDAVRITGMEDLANWLGNVEKELESIRARAIELATKTA